MTIERISKTFTHEHAGERFPWLLPESGVHTVQLRPADVATALDVSDVVAQRLVSIHLDAVTSYDSDTVTAGCGCGWVSDAHHDLDDTGRNAAAEAFAAHLFEAASNIEFSG